MTISFSFDIIYVNPARQRGILRRNERKPRRELVPETGAVRNEKREAPDFVPEKGAVRNEND